MANTTNIDIILDGQYHLEYETAESLGIKFSRKVDDMNNLSKRFGDFSYTFQVPLSKNNNRVFSHANALGKQKIFVGQTFDCIILNNDKLILKGILELTGINANGYDVVIHSMLKEFIDAVGDLELQDIDVWQPVPFNYEQTIIDHINANYANSDEALYQFPFVFYNTVYCPTSVFTGKTDNRGIKVYSYDTYDNHYYVFNNTLTGGDNEVYYHQLPPALYLVRVLEACFNTSQVGWQIGGSWIQQEEVKKIILPAVGPTDIYDRCLVTGSTAVLRPQLFLAEGVKIIDFISSVLNAFNLYFVIDAENKQCVIEPWHNLFLSQENPYDLTNIINASTIKIEKPDNANPSVQFKDMKKPDDEKGEFILGDNMVLSNNTNDSNTLAFQSISNKNANAFYNKIGTDDEVKIGFGTPRVKRMFLWNDKDSGGTNHSHGVQTIFIPAITKSNPGENNGKKFNKNDLDTVEFNTEDTQQYAGLPTMYYYVCQSNADNNEQYMYINIPTGVHVINRTKIGFCSPFMLSTYRANINTYLASLTSGSTLQRDIITCSYLQSTYAQFYRSDNNIVTTPYSLVFDDDNSYHDTLYTVYHQAKYNRYQNSSILTADLALMSENDWNAMNISRPLIYRGEIYHMIELVFDPIKRSGTIKMIKDL
jgi:hypothetical protein